MPKPQFVIPQCLICGRTVMRGISICPECSRSRDQIQRGVPVAPEPEVAVLPAPASMREPRPDLVNHPPHYKTGDIECIDAIEAALTPEEFRGYCKGNALKYTWREKHKGGDQDLAKAEWYLNRLKK